MSGYLGLAVNELALLRSQPAPLIIGSLILQGYEVPSRITIGGSQSVIIHKLPGHGRIIDAMGSDDGAIAWRGLFIGPDAARRVRSLDAMRVQGTQHILSFGDYTFNVIVVHCEYDYQNHGAVINYRIKTEIVPNQSNLSSTTSDIDLVLQDDLDRAQNLLEKAAASTLTYAALAGKSDAMQITSSAFALNAIAADVGVIAVMAEATMPSALPGNSVIQTGLQAIGTKTQRSIQNIQISAESESLIGPSFINASTLTASTAQAVALAALVQAGGYVNRVRTNIASSSTDIVTPLVHA